MYTGSSRNTETINQNNLKWQVLRVYDNGNIDLVGEATEQEMYFDGPDGYNKGVKVMNEICETLYSRGNIKARSIKYEDIEYWLTDAGQIVRDGYSTYEGGPTYRHTQTYKTNKYYPNLYVQEKGGKIDSGMSGLTEGIDQEVGNTSGLEISQEGTASGSTQASTSLTITQTYWVCEMNSENFGEGYKALGSANDYWVASRCVSCYSDQGCFGLRIVYNSNFSYDQMLYSNGVPNSYMFYLRPVVSLGYDVQIETCAGENGKTNMHTIEEY